MRRILGVMGVLVLCTGAEARPDRNAFLNERAANLGQLMAQIKRDPEVRDRFRRHFGMSDVELTAYVSTLHPVRLTKKKTYIVYSVPPDGSIKAHVETFHPGTAIYADVTGVPILIAKCGNPLYLGPKSNVARNDVEAPMSALMSGEKEMETGIGPAEELVTANTIMTPDEPLQPIESVGEKPAVIPGAILAPLISPWWLGALGLGVLGLNLDNDDNGNTLVPEPATFAALGIGIVALAKRRKTRRLKVVSS